MNQTRDDKQDEFDVFLSKVKEVGSIINDISSPDIEISKIGIEKASRYLHNSVKGTEEKPDEDGIVTVYSRSSLNRKALEDTSKPPLDFSGMNPEEFMAAVEQDAKERSERKRMQKKAIS